jgi:hypothetical protein
LVDARRQARLPGADDPNDYPGLALSLQESRNDLMRWHGAFIYRQSMHETGNYVALSDDGGGLGGAGERTSTSLSGVKDGVEEKFDYILFYYQRSNDGL